MLSSHAYLVGIKEITELDNRSDFEPFLNNPFFRLEKGEEYHNELYVQTKEEGQLQSDTLSELLPSHLIFDNRSNFMAVLKYDGDYDFEGSLDTVFSKEKAGIRIYSLATGVLHHFISCYGYYPLCVFPIAIAADGSNLIYYEESRGFSHIWHMDYRRGERVAIQTIYDGMDDGFERGEGSFSPNNEYYCMHYLNGEICISSTSSDQIIHRFKYESCDSVFWNEDNHICMLSEGYIYEWEIRPESSMLNYKTTRFIRNVAISRDNGTIAAINSNGDVYVLSGRSLQDYYPRVIACPGDIEFTEDGKELWVISGYNEIKGIDLEKKRVSSIYSEEDGIRPPTPYVSSLYFTKDGKHCIAFTWGGGYASFFDVKTKEFVRQELSSEEVKKEYGAPDGFEYVPDDTKIGAVALTSCKYSVDSAFVVEGYSDGMIKVRSLNVPVRSFCPLSVH